LAILTAAIDSEMEPIWFTLRRRQVQAFSSTAREICDERSESRKGLGEERSDE
jgi:hypothetical protein